jgi:AcrR family transcriptional regulator
MSNRKHRESMEKLDKCFGIVQQSGAKGLRATEIAGKLGIHRSTVYKHLDSLELMGRIESKHGIWYAKTGEQTIKPLEKEIEIVLPLPLKQVQNVALMEILTKQYEDINFPKSADFFRTFLEKFRETRTIRIKGKNVDDIDLEKLGKMIQQATEKSYKFNFKRLFKGLI